MKKDILVSVFKIANDLKGVVKLLLGQKKIILKNSMSDPRFMYPINTFRVLFKLILLKTSVNFEG